MKAHRREAGVEKLSEVTCVRRQKLPSCSSTSSARFCRGGTARAASSGARKQPRRLITITSNRRDRDFFPLLSGDREATKDFALGRRAFGASFVAKLDVPRVYRIWTTIRFYHRACLSMIHEMNVVSDDMTRSV